MLLLRREFYDISVFWEIFAGSFLLIRSADNAETVALPAAHCCTENIKAQVFSVTRMEPSF